MFQAKIAYSSFGCVVTLFIINILAKMIPLFRGIMIHPDAPVYLWAAQSLQKGDMQAASQSYPMLFYPFLIMIVQKLGFDWLTAGRIISTTASCLVVFPFWGLAKRFSPGWPAVTISLVFIFLPDFNKIAFAVLRDPLYICLSIWCLYFTAQFLENPGAVNRFWPVLLNAACLPFVRVEGVIVACIVICWCTVVLLRTYYCSISLRATLIAVVTMCCVMVFFYVLNVDRSILRLDDIAIHLKSLRAKPPALENYLSQLDELAHSSSILGNNFWRVIRRHWVWIYGIGILYAFVKILGWLFVFMAGYGLFFMRDKDKITRLLHVLLPSYILLFFLYFMTSGQLEVRYLILPSVILLLFASKSFRPLVIFLSDNINKKCQISYIPVIIIFSCLLILPLCLKSVKEKYRYDNPVIKESSLFIKNKVLKHNKQWLVLANERRIAWYLDYDNINLYPKLEFEKAFQVIKERQGPIVIIFLMSKYDFGKINISDRLDFETYIRSRIFLSPNSKKHVVVALWKSK